MNSSKRKPLLNTLLKAPGRGAKKVMDGMLQTSENLERRLKRVRLGTDRVGDSLHKADSILLQLFKRILSPFTWIGTAWLAIAPVAQSISASSFVKRLEKATYWLWYPLVAISSFFSSFLYTRRRALLLWMLPVVMLLGGAFLTLWFLAPRTASISQKYRSAMQEAISQGDFQQAQLYQQKLQSLGVRSRQSEMQPIEALAQSGNMDQAVALAEQMAPLDQPGFPEAHFWLARKYFEDQAPLQGEPALTRAQTHLDLLEQALGELNISVPPNVVLLRALIEFKKGEVELGLQRVKSVSGQFWPAMILQLETHARLGMNEPAFEDALAISQMIKREPVILDDVSSSFFQMWCQTLAAAGAREELKTAIQHWFAKYPDDPQAETGWATLQFMEIESLMNRGSEQDLVRATKIMIQTTNQLGAKQRPMISRWWSEHLPPKKNNSNFLRLAEIAADHEEASSTLLEALGTSASVRNDPQRALELLKRAAEKDSTNVIALNNLAFVISDHFQEELPLAIESVEKAVQLQPDNMAILHTRGILYVRLEQWEKAIPDLVAVAAKNPNAADVHSGLAVAYRRIGKPELAAFHETLAR
jgi:tetratricopeptide (TPR) repeat protein